MIFIIFGSDDDVVNYELIMFVVDWTDVTEKKPDPMRIQFRIMSCFIYIHVGVSRCNSGIRGFRK